MKERFSKTFDKIKISQEAHDRILAKVKEIEVSHTFIVEPRKERKSFWNKKRLAFSFSGIFLIILGLIIFPLFKSNDNEANIFKGGDWTLKDENVIDPGWYFGSEIIEEFPVNAQDIEIKLYPGHRGYFTWLQWHEYNQQTQLWESTFVEEDEMDELVFEIICENSQINFQPVAIDFLSDDYQIIIYDDMIPKQISYKTAVETSLPASVFSENSGTIAFFLRMRNLDNSKQAKIVGRGITYEKEGDMIKIIS